MEKECEERGEEESHVASIKTGRLEQTVRERSMLTLVQSGKEQQQVGQLFLLPAIEF